MNIPEPSVFEVLSLPNAAQGAEYFDAHYPRIEIPKRELLIAKAAPVIGECLVYDETGVDDLASYEGYGLNGAEISYLLWTPFIDRSSRTRLPGYRERIQSLIDKGLSGQALRYSGVFEDGIARGD